MKNNEFIVTELSEKEMKEASGGWVFFAIGLAFGIIAAIDEHRSNKLVTL